MIYQINDYRQNFLIQINGEIDFYNTKVYSFFKKECKEDSVKVNRYTYVTCRSVGFGLGAGLGVGMIAPNPLSVASGIVTGVFVGAVSGYNANKDFDKYIKSKICYHMLQEIKYKIENEMENHTYDGLSEASEDIEFQMKKFKKQVKKVEYVINSKVTYENIGSKTYATTEIKYSI